MTSMFPRGGSVKPTKAARPEGEPASDQLFAYKSDPKKRPKRRASNAAAGDPDEQDPVFRALSKRAKQGRDRPRRDDGTDFAAEGGKPSRAFRLAKKTLRPGTLALGVVLQVSKLEAQVSLPGNIIGKLRAEHLSDQHASGAEDAEMDLTDGYLHVGQVVRCAVLDADSADKQQQATAGKGLPKFVPVTTAASVVNKPEWLQAVKSGSVVVGTVRSVEDHGYIMDVGDAGVATGFLSFEDGGGSIDDPSFKVGQPVEAVVISVSGGASAGEDSDDDDDDDDGKKSKKKSKKNKKRKKKAKKTQDTAGSERRTFKLKVDAEESLRAVCSASNAPSFEGLQPGMRVPGEVSEYLEDGLYVFFLDMFHGTVDAFHSTNRSQDFAGRKGRPASGARSVDARILFVDFHNKRVGLTCADRLVNRTRAIEVEEAAMQKSFVGRVVEGAIVRRVDAGRGVLLELPASATTKAATGKDSTKETKRSSKKGDRMEVEDEDDVVDNKTGKEEEESDGSSSSDGDSDGDSDDESMSTDQGETNERQGGPLFAYAWRSRMARESDNSGVEVTQLDSRFKVGQQTPCKVLAHAAADGILNVSLAKSVIEASVLLYDELKPGLKVNGKVVKVDDAGVVVALSEHVRGYVPLVHLADVLLSDPQRRFKVGQVVSARVLNVDTTSGPRPRVKLTMKRSLMNSTLPMITSREDATPGTVAHGFVTKTDKERGVYVSFFGDVFGNVQGRELAALGVDDINAAYPVGKVVKVKVLPGKRHVLPLSFRTLKSAPEGGASMFAEGSIVSGKVVRVTPTEAHVRLLPPQPPGAKGSSKGGEGPAVVLSATHMSDHPERSLALFKQLRQGKTIDGAMVLRHNRDGSTMITLKPLLLLAQRRSWIPSKLEDVGTGTHVVGYAHNVTERGVFVSFLGGLSALAPLPNIADTFVRDAREHFRTGQTVVGKVVATDSELKRITLSLRESVLEPPTEVLTRLAESALEEGAALRSGGLPADLKFKVGDVVSGEVSGASAQALHVELPGKVAGVCPRRLLSDEQRASLKPGDKLRVRVVAVDHDAGTVCVAAVERLVKPVMKGDGTAARSKLHGVVSSNTLMQATVEYVMENRATAVVSIDSCGAQLALVPLHGSLFETLRFLPQSFGPGSECSVHVVRALLDSEAGLALATLDSASVQGGRPRRRSRSSSIDEGALRNTNTVVALGHVVQGRVLSMRQNWMNVSLHRARLADADTDDCGPLRGHVHVTEALGAEALEEAATNRTCAFSAYSVGDHVEGVVVGIEHSKDSNNKPLVNVYISLAAQQDDGEVKPGLAFEDMRVGDEHACFVERVTAEGVLVVLSRQLRGFIFCTQLSEDVDMLDNIFNQAGAGAGEAALPPTTALKAKVVHASQNEQGTKVELTALL